MSFLETVERARAFLERNGRVSRRALQREFDLDDSALDELIEELVEIQRVGVREGGALAWAGAVPPARTETLERERVPRDYTPKHLVDKILTFRSALEGERKQVTVLFADVEGSMDLQESIDLEQWHQIVDRFFQILADGVHRFEGTINQYTGDGIMALFGAPIAHEDHAQRACYSALYLRQNLQRYAQELKREQELSFPVRMGLNSGTVIVGKIGDDLRMDYTAQGHTVGLAARMEKLADSGKVYMAEPTARRVEGFVRSEDLGEFNIAGASEPIRVFELMGAGPLRTRFDLSRARGLSRFVGRADEMATLEAGLEQARTGEGGVIGVVAEAGTGKSRLCFEFLEHARARGFPVHEARGLDRRGRQRRDDAGQDRSATRARGPGAHRFAPGDLRLPRRPGPRAPGPADRPRETSAPALRNREAADPDAGRCRPGRRSHRGSAVDRRRKRGLLRADGRRRRREPRAPAGELSARVPR
ncbi:MAG: adenylate/guanylate cyclase domain-containing protein [Deltaproteobacteria bacterium]|nr:adenylate/guanylate cyclase domain-containing protein [Deltaproteobacteria bacterium]